MRDYAKVDCGFWNEPEGKALTSLGYQAVSVFFYLITAKSSHSSGLYSILLDEVAKRLHMELSCVIATVKDMEDQGILHYDAEFEVVWIPSVLRWSNGEALTPSDKRAVGLRKWVKKFRHSPLYQQFLDANGQKYGLLTPVDKTPSEGLDVPSEGLNETLGRVERNLGKGTAKPSEGRQTQDCTPWEGLNETSEGLDEPFRSIDERRATKDEREKMSDERTRARPPGEPTTPPAWPTSQTGHASPNSEDRAEAVRLLVRAGLTSQQALTIADSKPLAAIKRQLGWLPRRQARNPVAVLIDSIMLDWEEPAWQEPASKGAA